MSASMGMGGSRERAGRRSWLGALAGLVCVAGAVGCKQEEQALTALLAGAQDLAVVGDLLFVLSSDRSELRVLDLATDEKQSVRAQPIRAPNPLEPLAIALRERPGAMVADVGFSDVEQEDGSTVVGGRYSAGSYLYVTSPGGAGISIIGAARNSLVELMRLPTAAPVTAVAGRSLGDAGASSLYCATFDGSVAELWEIPLPAPDALVASSAEAIRAGGRKLAVTFSGESVSALAPLPGNRLAFSTRALAGVGGRTEILDLASGARVTAAFPGPVRQLLTHPAGGGLAAGARLFGLLDERGCQPGQLCGGVMAVESATGAVVADASGAPMLPIRWGGALVRGLAIAPSIQLTLGAEATTQPLVGAATLSNGEFFLFDAVALRHFDFDSRVGGVQRDNVTYREAVEAGQTDGRVRPYVGGPIVDDPATPDVDENTIVGGDGAVRDEVISVVYQGQIPGLIDLSTSDADGVRFRAPGAVAARAKLGDLVVTAGCELPVTAIDADGVLVASVVGCSGRERFSVRATGGQPFVVAGTFSGYLGRVGPLESFSYQGNYVAHLAGFSAASPAPQLAFKMGALDPEIRRDFHYLLPMFSGFSPFVGYVDQRVGGLVHLPLGVAFDSHWSNPSRQGLFMAFPSDDSGGDVVIHIPTASIVRGGNALNILPYR